MLLHRILGLEERESIFLAEESLEDLATLPVTTEIMSAGLQAEAAIEIEGKGVAFRLSGPEKFWLLLTDRYSDGKLIQPIEGSAVRRVQASDDEFLEAVVEYFAEALTEGLLCDGCDIQTGPLYIEDRIERLRGFLEGRLPAGSRILEVGCGSGMATQSLKRLGHDPWAMEIDRCELCQGLKAKRISPARSFVLDARNLLRFFPERSFDTVVGFMVGMIDDVNWRTWREILLTASRLAADRVIYTVYTKREADLIAKTLEAKGFRVDVIDNRDPGGIYDQWAVLAAVSH